MGATNHFRLTEETGEPRATVLQVVGPCYARKYTHSTSQHPTSSMSNSLKLLLRLRTSFTCTCPETNCRSKARRQTGVSTHNDSERCHQKQDNARKRTPSPFYTHSSGSRSCSSMAAPRNTFQISYGTGRPCSWNLGTLGRRGCDCLLLLWVVHS